MVFSSFLFIFGFLPIFLSIYFLVPARMRNHWVLAASYVFYAWGAPSIVALLLVSSVFDYLLVAQLNRSEGTRRRAFLIVAVASNVLLLGYYKYANFFVHQLQQLGIGPESWSAVLLPIGISFFTFQKISYIVDVYRRTSPPAASMSAYLLYVVLFPQLIAGPILRYHDVESQIRTRVISLELFLYGAVRFMVGLSKKVLLANEMGAVADNVFSLPPEQLSASYAWLGAVAYSFQIYFDFSGYSDMAIGLCALIGFRIPENFCMPYASRTITEFWRRWHISLSTWMKEYLYIPLGGNRGGAIRTACNLWIVFLLSGLWHGAGWTFIAWGALHGFFLSLERVAARFVPVRIPYLCKVFYVWLVVLASWVLFRAENFSQAWDFLTVQYSFADSQNPPAFAAVMHQRASVVFVICTALIFSSLIPRVRKAVEAADDFQLRWPFWSFGFAYACLLLSTVTLATTAFNPFIYFRF